MGYFFSFQSTPPPPYYNIAPVRNARQEFRPPLSLYSHPSASHHSPLPLNKPRQLRHTRLLSQTVWNSNVALSTRVSLVCVCVYAGLEFLQRSGRRAVAAVKMVIGRCYISQPPTAVCWQFSLCRPPRTWKRRKTDQVGQKREKLCNNKKAFSFLFLFFRFLRSAHNSSRLPGVRHKAPATVSSGDCFEKSSASRFLARLCHFFLADSARLSSGYKLREYSFLFPEALFLFFFFFSFLPRQKRKKRRNTPDSEKRPSCWLVEQRNENNIH